MISEEEKQRIINKFEEYEKSIRQNKSNKDKLRMDFNEFYNKEVFPKVFENFEIGKKVKILVLTVGFSYEPIVLSIKYHQPERVVLIYTEDSRKKSKEKIIEYMKKMNLDYARIVEEKIIDLNNASREIFKIIKKIYMNNQENINNIVVDLTGGTKEMPAAVAIATYYLKIQCCYVASDFSSDLRKSRPFSERIKEFNSLLYNYIDLTSEEFIEKINNYQFKEAKDMIEEIKERMKLTNEPSIVSYNILIDISNFFINLMNKINLERVSLKFGGEVSEEGRLNVQLSNDIIIKGDKITNFLIKHIRRLQSNKKDERDNTKAEKYYLYIIRDLMITTYLRKKGGLALALKQLHTILEHIKNYKLTELGKDPDNFDWSDIDIERFKSIFKRFKREEYNKEKMPSEIALMDGMTIIKTLNDNILSDEEMKEINKIIDKRNKLTHSSIEKIERVNLDEKEIYEKTKFVLELANKIIEPKERIELEDFESLLIIE